MVIFNKERYERIKGIVGSAGRKILRRKRLKKLSAKNRKVFILPDKHINSDYEPSSIICAYESDVWRWRRVNEWFNNLSYDNDGIKKCRGIKLWTG